MPDNSHYGETEILFTIKTTPRPGDDGISRVTLEGINPRTAGGTPGLPPGVPPKPPSRKIIAGYVEEVVLGDVRKLRFVFDVEAGHR